MREHIHARLAKCAIASMSLGLTRPPLADSDDVNANKSLYGNKRETPSIRCREPADRAGRRAGPIGAARRRVHRLGSGAGDTGQRVRPRYSRTRRDSARPAGYGETRCGEPGAGAGSRGPGAGSRGPARGAGAARFRRTGAGRLGTAVPAGVRRDRPRAGHSQPVTWAKIMMTKTGERHGPGLAGHVRLAGNLGHKNPSASDIHPRNRTRAENVSLGTDDAIQGHRTGPGAIPRNKEGKDGC
jgi:hypothetical protein